MFVVHFPGPRPGGAEQARRWVAGRAGGALAAGGARVELGERFYTPESTRLHGIRWTGGRRRAARVVRRTGAGARDRAARAVPAAGGGPARGPRRGRRRGARPGDARRPASRLDRAAQRGAALHGRRARRARRCASTCGPDVGAGRRWASAPIGEPLGVPVIGVHAGGGWRGRRGPGGAGAGRADGRARPPRHLRPPRSPTRGTRSGGSSASGTGRAACCTRPVGHDGPRREGPGDPVGRPLLPARAPATTRSSSRWSRRSATSWRAAGPTAGSTTSSAGAPPSTGPTSTRSGRPPRACRWSCTPTPRGPSSRDLYGRASIFWHAAGLGEDPERHPDRYEHFGITTVEAMSAGAVPVVIDAAGQVEIVEHGANGLPLRRPRRPGDAHRRLIADPAWRDVLSVAAERRAHDFVVGVVRRRGAGRGGGARRLTGPSTHRGRRVAPHRYPAGVVDQDGGVTTSVAETSRSPSRALCVAAVLAPRSVCFGLSAFLALRLPLFIGGDERAAPPVHRLDHRREAARVRQRLRRQRAPPHHRGVVGGSAGRRS